MPKHSAQTLFQQAQALLAATPPDYTAALPLLAQAAGKGHTEAAFQLAGCYFHGHGTVVDYTAAEGWLQKAAAADHPYARHNLLQLREHKGEPVSSLLAEYTQLAQQGFLPAQVRLMRHYNDHHHPAALHWTKQAAAQGHPEAQYHLAQYYQTAATPDLPRAHALYRQAAVQGLAGAHWQLGNQYRYGQAVAPDLDQAAHHLRIAAEKDITEAQTALAEILLQQGSNEALVWFQKAAAQHDSNAHAALAQIYLLGQHVERQYALARRHAEAAARHQHAEALRLLGDIHRYGLGMPADADSARIYYQRAAALGSAAAHQKLLADSALNRQNDYAHAQQNALMQQKAEQDYQAAFASHYGLNRPQDYAAARTLYQEAARQGHGKALTNLGMMAYSGQGCAPDPATAARYFAQAAEQGDPMAQYNLACLYYHGHGVPQNTESACRWLQRAIECGHVQPDALLRLLQQWHTAGQSAEPPSASDV